MKRSACLLMALLFLIGCGRKVIAPSAETVSVTHRPDITAFSTQSPVIEAESSYYSIFYRVLQAFP